MANLPEPFNPTEIFLKAILDKLEEIHPTEQGESNEVQLREPAQPRELVVDHTFPDNFPGAFFLREHGIRTIENIPQSLDGLTQIKGIGETKARAILDALSKV